MIPIHVHETPATRLRWLAVLVLTVATLVACGRQAAPPPDDRLAPAVVSEATLDVPVAGATDDAEEGADGKMSLYSSDLELTYDGSEQVVGVRFAGLAVPAGATIVDAYVQFTVDETSSEPTVLEIRAQAADDAPPFGTGSGNLSGRPLTTEAVTWEPPPWTRAHDAGPEQRTPNLAAVVQEVVERPGWSSGNALALLIRGSGRRVAEAFVDAPGYEPVLHLVYAADRSVRIASFGHAPEPASPGEPVAFSWSVADDDGDPVACSLDVDGDAAADYEVDDCLDVTGVAHAYADAGSYVATLLATDATGVTATASTVVTVSLGAERIVEVTIAATADDAEERPDGRVSRSSPDLELVEDGSVQRVGLRFAGLDVPAGAAILTASVQFQVDERTSDAASLTLHAQAVDDAADFASNFSVSSRALTAASVAWSPPPWTRAGDRGPDQRTPDLAALVQEVVDRPGWRRGNALALVVSGSGRRVAEAFDGDPAGAPMLHVEYSVDDTLHIDGFEAVPDAASLGEPVEFRWSVRDDDGDPVRCSLDVDGDGAADYDVDDCLATTRLDHAFASTGVFDAVLVARSGTVSRRQATARVSVGSDTSTVLAAAGDIACDPDSEKFNGGEGTDVYCHERRVADMIVDLGPDLVLPLGDVQYEEGTLDQFQRSYDLSWGRFKDISRPAVGNHEYLDPGAAGYFQYFGPLAGSDNPGFYSFDVNGWHVVALNSNCSKAGGCRAGSPQERWLRQDLAAHPAACILAYWHHPRFSSGAIGGRDWTIDMWRALQDAGADVVLVGHDHNYERFAPQDADGNADPDGIRQFVVGTGGKNHTSIYTVQPNSEVRRSGTYGFLKLVLHATSYDWEFVGEPGSSFGDAGSAPCN